MNPEAQADHKPHAWSDAQWRSAAQEMQAEADAQLGQVRSAVAELAPWGAGPASTEQLLAFYERARQALIEERFEEASRDLLALCAVRPDQSCFFFGLGLSLQMMGHPEQALDAYGAAYLLDARDPACLLRMGECMQALNRLDNARQAWLTGIKLCNRPGVDLNLRGLLTAALDTLSAR